MQKIRCYLVEYFCAARVPWSKCQDALISDKTLLVLAAPWSDLMYRIASKNEVLTKVNQA
jgi:hypothetical protein